MFLNVDENQRKVVVLKPVSLALANIVNSEIKERPHLGDVTFIDCPFSEELEKLTIKIVMMRRNVSQCG